MFNFQLKHFVYWILDIFHSRQDIEDRLVRQGENKVSVLTLHSQLFTRYYLLFPE